MNLPEVIIADFITAGDQFGWKDLTYAAVPATCGQAIEVPDIIVNFEYCVSPFSPVSVCRGVYDAKMSTPGAAISGFSTCFVPGFGPLDENEAIKGAEIFTSSDLYITADGDLHFSKRESCLHV